VVAVLEHKDLQAQVAQARAALETATAAVQAAEVNLQDAQREKTRMENLFQQGSATEQQRDRAVAAYDRAVAGLAQAKAQLAQAQAALDLAEVTYNEAFLKSPLTGVVTAKYVDPGAMVGPGTAILQVQAMEQLKFIVAIPAESLPRIDPDKTRVDMQVGAYPGRLFKARISQVYPTVETTTRTTTLELLVDNAKNERGEYLLRPGMYAVAKVVLQTKPQAIVVPMDALIRLLDKYYAFVVEDDKAKRREVGLGIRSGQFVEVISGLSAGEELVVSGQHRLVDGTRIERVKEDLTGGQVQ
jgi:RND family efflux transporter MFP subunit